VVAILGLVDSPQANRSASICSGVFVAWFDGPVCR
jgi:hypothetical protein